MEPKGTCLLPRRKPAGLRPLTKEGARNSAHQPVEGSLKVGALLNSQCLPSTPGWGWRESWLLLGTGIQKRGEACLGKSQVVRNFLTLSRVILDSRRMGPVNLWDLMLLPCSLAMAQWPALQRKENSKVKESSDKETRWGGSLTHFQTEG